MQVTTRGALITMLAVVAAAQAAAGPAALLWRTEAEALEAAGSFAPPAVLGEPRADYPTSLADADRPLTTLQVRKEVPLTLRRGNAERGRIESGERELRVTIPLAGDDPSWHVGWRVLGSASRVYHRLRWDETILHSRASDTSLGAAFRDDPWTAGVATRELDLTGDFTGSMICKLQHVGPAREGVSATLDDTGGVLGLEYDAGRWLVGARVADGDATTRIPVEAEGDVFLGVFTSNERQLDAWLTADRGCDRWFAYARDRELHPEAGAVMRGTSIRGRGDCRLSSSVIGVGRRRTSRGRLDHLELSYHDDSLDLSGLLDRGALGGGLTGQYSVWARARVESLALHWSRRRQQERWSWLYGMSAVHSRIDFHGRYVDLPAPLLPPDHRWEQRLRGGDAWLLAATLGCGYQQNDWRADATLTVIGGDLSAEFEDLTATTPPDEPTPGPSPPSPEQPSGPGSRLDPGWIFSLSISHAL